MLLVMVLCLAARALAQPLVAHAGNAVPMCAGGPQTLGATPAATGGTGPYQYSWSPVAGLSATNVAHPICTASVTTIYTLTVTDANNNTATDQVTVTVLPSASALLTSSNAQSTVFNGVPTIYKCSPNANSLFSFDFAGSATPGSSHTIVWGNGNPDMTATGSTWPTATNVYGQGISTLTYTIIQPNGCNDTETYSVFLGTTPAGAIVSPGGTVGCGPVTLTFPLTGWNTNTPGTLYTITFNDGSPASVFTHPPPNNITHTFSIGSCGTTSSDGSNTYQNSYSANLLVANPCGSTGSTVLPIVVSLGATSDFTISPNDTACVNSQVNFTSTSTGNDIQGAVCDNTPALLWSIMPAAGWSVSSGSLGNSNGFTGANYDPTSWSSGSQTLGVTFSTPGTYTMTLVTGNSCGGDTISRSVCIESPPTPAFTISPGTGCVPLVSQTDNTSNSVNSCYTHYNWVVSFTGSICGSVGGESFSGGTSATSFEPQITFSQAGNYQVQLQAINSCGTYPITQNVSVAAPPQLSVYTVGPICAGQSIFPVGAYQTCGTPITGYSWTLTGGSPASANTQSPGGVQYTTPGNYTVSTTATSACGPGTVSTPLVVNNVPTTANATVVQDTVCAGGTIQLQATTLTGATYQWSGPNGFFSAQEDPQLTNVTTLAQGTYTVTAYLGVCAGPSSSVNVVVLPADQITIQPVSAICIGDSAHLIASGSSNYTWTTSGGTPVGNGANIWVHPTTTTTYVVNSAAGGNGCPGTQSVMVTVDQPTALNVQGTMAACDQPIGQQLSAAPAGGAWSGADIVNLTPGGLVTPIAGQTGSDVLIYTYTNAQGCTSTAQCTVTIQATVYAQAGNDTLVCEDGPVFPLNGAPAGGTWTGTGVVGSSFDPSDQGTFVLVYSIGTGSCATTDQMTVTVPAATVVSAGSDFAICQNAAPVLLSNGTPAGGTWSGVGVSFNAGQYHFDPAAGDQALTYSYTNASGCSGSAVVNVDVTPPPVADAGPDTTLCDQAIAYLLVGNYAPAGTWTSTSPYFSALPSPTFTPAPNAFGTWSVVYTYTDAGGCTDRDTALITVVDLSVLAFAGNDTSICANGGAVLLGAAPSNGTWASTAFLSNTGTFDPAVAGIGAHTVSYCVGVGTCANCDQRTVTVDPPPNVTATSPLGFCDYEPIQDLVENPQGGTWSGSTGLTNTTQGLFDPGLAPLGANQLIYVWQDASTQCKDTAFVSITVNQEPVASFTHAAVACQYDGTFTFTADNTAGNITSWQWNFGDGSAPASGQVVQHAFQQVDTVTVTLVVGTGNCTDTTTSTVMVWPAPVADLTLDTTSGCGPLTVQFTNSSAGPALSYAWSINNTIVSNDATFGPYAFAAGVLTDTTYAIELDVTNQCGSSSALDTVVVFSSPTAYFGPDFNGGCSPFTVHFVNASVGDADSYTWDWGDGSTPSNSTSVIVAHTFTTGANDTTYTVTLTATNECGTDTHTYTILVHPNTITAFFNTDTTQGCAPLTVCYTQYSVGVTNWHWEFGYQNNTSNAQSPCFNYPEAGTFTATLFGDNGCSYDTVSVQITVWPSPPVSFTFAPDPVCGNIPVQFTNNTPDLAWCHWTFGDGDSSALTNPTHVFNTGSSYQVHLDAGWTQNTCTAASNGTVTVYAVPEAVPGPTDSVFCAPQVMAATNASIGSNLAYQWSLNGVGIGAGQLPPPQAITDPGPYTLQLIVVDQISGCRDTTSTTWVANPSPTSAFELQPVDPCGRPAWLDAVDNSTAGAFPEWWLDNTFISAQDVLHYALIGEGIHTLALVSTLPPGGCTDTTRTEFELYALPVAAFTADTACTGHFIPLHDASLGAAQEWWYYNGVYVSTDQFTHAMVPHATGTDTIGLTVMSDHGCTDSTSRIVRVYPTSPSTFTPELVGDCQTVLLAPDTVMAHTSYQWTINNNWVSPDVRPTFYYDANSVANIPMILVATTEDGCRDTTISYFPIPDCVHVPNSFTPDGDGLNDRFIPVILPPEHFEYLQIFDRWGEMIANITGTRTPAWDGTCNGELVQVGVYVWRLKLTSRMDPYIGHVTVVR